MSNTKHTPGPWAVFPKDGTMFVYCDDSVGSIIADCSSAYTPLLKEQKESNAKLISAAPELLEACELMLSAFANAPACWLPTKDVQDAELLMNKAVNKATE